MADARDEILYFAYGSNMHLKQMSERCRSSRMAGTAVLPGYRWQINERGVANVVPSPNHQVEGILFRINDEERKRLDRYEGYGKFYDRQELVLDAKLVDPHVIGAMKLAVISRRFRNGCNLTSVIKSREREETAEKTRLEEVYSLKEEYTHIDDKDKPLPPQIARRNIAHVTQGPPSPRHYIPRRETIPRRVSPREAKSQYPKDCRVKALVYLSREYSVDGDIREEYITRMNNAMIDARKAGISPDYVRTCIEPLVKGKDTVAAESLPTKPNSKTRENSHQPRLSVNSGNTTHPSRSASSLQESDRVHHVRREVRLIRHTLSDDPDTQQHLPRRRHSERQRRERRSSERLRVPTDQPEDTPWLPRVISILQGPRIT